MISVASGLLLLENAESTSLSYPATLTCMQNPFVNRNFTLYQEIGSQAFWDMVYRYNMDTSLVDISN